MKIASQLYCVKCFFSLFTLAGWFFYRGERMVRYRTFQWLYFGFRLDLVDWGNQTY